ncbi:RNA cap guanine-N2 methyltransferase [Dictyocaulus viviparus]|uniref:Trimethylguanosine synthase n=1 Tax=Dictyocaulus viviparus TaxID=29172 RepID=A0A0D8XG52_DICVI|nr:RNA cap guanine-N2 methyltransferase [Dictyocaulus viviparus]
MNDIFFAAEEEFRFPWELLCDFYAIFRRRNSSDDITYNYDCCFSRVDLDDKNLVILSEHTRPSLCGEDISSALEAMDITENNKSDSQCAEENSVTDSEILSSGNDASAIEPSKDLNTELPKRFGSFKMLEHSKSYRKKRKSHDDAQRWLRNTTFEEYWEEAASYLIYRTWYEDYGHIMNEDDRIQLARQVAECKPMVLIDEHAEEKLSKYYGISKDVSFSSYEELFALHSELVMKMASKDFEQFRSSLLGYRCKAFFKKIEKMGFVPGYSDADMNKIEVASPSKSDNVITERIKTPVKRKFATTYGDDEIFSDINYNIYDRRTASKTVILDRREKSTAEESSVKGEELPDNGIVSGSEENDSKKGEEIIKYWYQRYRLFSKLDDGVVMDREGWFSVTPERIAEHIADRIVRHPNMLIVDAFTGVGGNAIQLALKGARVIAIDLDPVRLKCARENARVYGVVDLIDFICCDFFHFASKWIHSVGIYGIDAVFLSPPWGGPSYLKSTVFDLDNLTPNGFDIFTAARKMSPNIAYFLPRNTAVKQLISLSGPGGRCEIEQSCLNKKIKTLTAYYGNLAVQRND